MITQLTIKNYALIEDIKVNFKEGLTIITGETGAGKSILLGALSLLLGRRADMSSIKDSSKKCIIEAEFNLEKLSLQSVFSDEDLDYEAHTIIRREILPSGKSRAFINDTPVNLNTLSLLGEHLIDIHNQHQTLQISSESFQMEVIDILAENAPALEAYKKKLNSYKKKKKQLTDLINNKAEAQKEWDYNLFLLTELQQAKLKPNEQQSLEEELETLSNVETIKETFSEISQLLDAENIGVLSVLSEINIKLNKVRGFSNAYQLLWERLQSAKIELDDIYTEVQDVGENLEANPQRLVELESYLQTIYSLQTKHHVDSVEGLLNIQKELEEKMEFNSSLDSKIQELEEEVKLFEKQLLEQAGEIHKKREDIIPGWIKKLESLLSQLGLPNARFKITLNKADGFLHNGSDTVEFLFTANKGTTFGEMKKVASGGELSRIMLAIKSVLAEHTQLPTIIFDEIDTGVSGEIANKIAEILSVMSLKMQVVSITHLPQIAAKGHHHFKVFKEDINNVTHTQLKLLDAEERVVELAQMLGGEKKSMSALAHARELLN